MTLAQMLDDLPRTCDVGTKRNAKGHTTSWIGYKLHMAGRKSWHAACALRRSRWAHNAAATEALEWCINRATLLHQKCHEGYRYAGRHAVIASPSEISATCMVVSCCLPGVLIATSHLRREERQHPMVAQEVGQVPGAGRAGTGDGRAEIHEDAVVELGAADARRLQHPEEPVLVKCGLGFRRQAPQVLGRSGALAQAWQQGLGPLQNRLALAGARGSGAIHRSVLVHGTADGPITSAPRQGEARCAPHIRGLVRSVPAVIGHRAFKGAGPPQPVTMRLLPAASSSALSFSAAASAASGASKRMSSNMIRGLARSAASWPTHHSSSALVQTTT